MQYWVAAGILAAANLGVADALDDTPNPVDETARRVGADASALQRLLRNLAGVGIFREGPKGYFINTPLSAALREDAPGNSRALIRTFGLKSFRQAMPEYESAIRSGGSAFEAAHGQGAGIFECLAARTEEADIYNRGMEIASDFAAPIAETYDFSGMDPLVDVGGGYGGFLSQVLKRNPTQRGILFDLPEVVAQAGRRLKEKDVDSRCATIAGDLRQDVPAGGAGYILKNIIHGYGDPDAIALLRRIRERGLPGMRVYIIENVMPEGNAPAPCKIFDLFLLLGGNGSRVRSEFEFRSLLHEAGFAFRSFVGFPGNLGVVEGTTESRERPSSEVPL